MKTSRSYFHLADLLLALALAASAFFSYLATLAPSLSYASPDGNELATVPFVLGLVHTPGYPLYTWLGKLFTLIPFGDVAHRMNLMSAVLGSLAVGGLYLLQILILPEASASPVLRRAGAALASLLFAFSATFWSQAVIAEVYAPNVAMIAATMLALLLWERSRRDMAFFVFALLFGLSLGTHLSNLGLAPAIAVFVLLTEPRCLMRPTWWLAALAGFGLGLAQFTWLPFAADSLNDRLMLARPPDSLGGIFQYTLGAFPQFKFAFSFSEIPDRIVVYLDILSRQFGLLGILLGFTGLTALLLTRPRHYLALIGMYLVQVWFFIQYRAFDLEVFFLPAHFLWAVFLGFAAVFCLGSLEWSAARLRGRAALGIVRGMSLLACAGVAGFALQGNWETNDRSEDVAVNDFYANVWEVLPDRAALLTPSGVFGYDAFYWRLVYGTRPDVLLPALATPDPELTSLAGREVYASGQTLGARNMGARGPGSLPRGLTNPDGWAIPVLMGQQTESGSLGSGRPMSLVHLSMDPPELVVDETTMDRPLEAEIGGITLVGVDLEEAAVESGGRVHVVLYWKLRESGRYRVQTELGGRLLESHDLGLGNLQRYEREVRRVGSGTIVEAYDLVVPSNTLEGAMTVSIRVQGVAGNVQVGEILVVNHEETVERWLRIAGRSP